MDPNLKTLIVNIVNEQLFTVSWNMSVKIFYSADGNDNFYKLTRNRDTIHIYGFINNERIELNLSRNEFNDWLDTINQGIRYLEVWGERMNHRTIYQDHNHPRDIEGTVWSFDGIPRSLNDHNVLPIPDVSLPEISGVKLKNKTDECFCLEPLLNGDSLCINTRCDHFYHYNCIKTWTDQGKSSCPWCRSSLKDTLAKVSDNTREIMLYSFGKHKLNLLKLEKKYLNNT